MLQLTQGMEVKTPLISSQTHTYAVLPAEGVALPGHHAVRGGRGGDRPLLRNLRRHPGAQRAALARLRGIA